ncbi:hypothetical protein ASZ90_009806 [hydrocarbon metagenome]|uniref:Uncharacterized protein n=1 Tax=hydrocarbon metagenome TaxID=938273 RepID=A0A0W8FIA4_9ZZZZ
MCMLLCLAIFMQAGLPGLPPGREFPVSKHAASTAAGPSPAMPHRCGSIPVWARGA